MWVAMFLLELGCSGEKDETAAPDTGEPLLEPADTGPAPEDTSTPPEDTNAADADADGSADADDCDDADPAIHPGADEICDNLDNDCDETVDEDAIDAGTFYADLDADHFGDADTSVVSCKVGTGWVQDDTDCDDSRADVYPGATEVCDNGVDEDCNAADATCT